MLISNPRRCTSRQPSWPRSLSLRPQAEAAKLGVAAAGGTPMHEMTPVEARALALPPDLAGPERALHSVVDRSVPGAGGEIPVRVYTPAPGSRFPGLIFFRGGGFVLGTLDSSDRMCRELAYLADRVVVSVDYRLAPEHRSPAAFGDVLASWQWLRAVRGVAAESVVLAGDSAGSGLTLALLQTLRDAGDSLPAGAVLISPLLDLSASGASIIERADEDLVFTPDLIKSVAPTYLGDADPKTPAASPLFGSMAGLPPLLVQGRQLAALSLAGAGLCVWLAWKLAASGADAAPRVWRLVAAISATVLAGWTALHAFGIPGLAADRGNWGSIAGLACAVLAATCLVLAVVATRPARQVYAIASRAPPASTPRTM